MARRAKTKPLPASTNPNWSFQRTRSQAGKGQANILVDLLLLKADDDHPKFEFFPKLPVEIRFKIWGYIEPKPCVIEPKGVGSDMYTTYSRKVPALLQVCRETRAEYLAKPGVIKNHITFTLCHGMSKWPWETAIYVALEHDLVVIHESCIAPLHCKDLFPLRYLAMGSLYVRRKHFRHLVNFIGLKSITTFIQPHMIHANPILPEIDGAFDLNNLHPSSRTWLVNDREALRKLCGKVKSRYPAWNDPDWNLPMTKLRAHSQMIAKDSAWLE